MKRPAHTSGRRESERAMTAKQTTPTRELATSLPQRLLDLLFPPRCVHCRASGALLCADCRGQIHEPPAPRCARCDRSLGAIAGLRCPQCAALFRDAGSPAVQRIVVASDYEGPAGSAIRALKFRRQRRLAPSLAELLIEAAQRAGVTPEILIPMPLHASRLRERGYNQAALLARPLARALRVPLRDDLLIRARATQPQTSLNRHERHANVAGAFALTALATTLLAGRRIALVDDVTTTGATLDAAADALLAAHPAAIYAFVVARPTRFTQSDGRAPDL